MSPATPLTIGPWPICIGLMAAALLAAATFGVFWPLALAVLVYLIWSGKMMCCMGPMTRWRGDLRKAFDAVGGDGSSTGNTAFDAYREETLKRLEEEQRAFAEFLGRLRSAKDKEEFERFMAERAHGRAQ
jgi:hypothetical protein